MVDVGWMVFGLVFLLLIAQYPLSLWIYFDAKRRDIENAHMYGYGLTLPLIGYVVIGYYVSNRETLPRDEGGQTILTMEKTGTTESTGKAEPASTAEESTHERFEFHSRWTGVSTLPDRLITLFQTEVGGFWVAGFVFLPTGLLIGAFATHPILGGYYFACCLLMILLLVELLRRNREMVGRIDTTARTMELQRRNVRKDAWNSMTTDIDLSTIESVRFFAIGDWLIGALDSSKPFVSHSFVLPEGRFEEAVDAFERCDIPVEPTIDSKPATLQLNRRLGKIQAVAALVSVFVVPVIVAVRFPDLVIPSGGFLFLAGYIAVIGISVSWTYLRKKFASDSDSDSRPA